MKWLILRKAKDYTHESENLTMQEDKKVLKKRKRKLNYNYGGIFMGHRRKLKEPSIAKGGAICTKNKVALDNNCI